LKTTAERAEDTIPVCKNHHVTERPIGERAFLLKIRRVVADTLTKRDKLKSKYREIIEAKNLLNLPERASMKEIKSNYRELIGQWHPDKCNESDEKCNEMTRKIIAAYDIIVGYCNQYQYSFSKEEIKIYLSDEEWWFERFGNDPIWGNRGG
jgi:preprotein translocase subunit Sec63